MPPASNEEQFKFLISCIRWSNSGKVDFGEVAKECSIVSKGAAAKRYERMMKAHGIAPNAASVRASPAARSFKTERKESSTPAKKRKMDDFAHDHGAAADDDETFDNIKSDPSSQGEHLHVKEEPGQMLRGTGDNHMDFISSLSGGSQEYLRADKLFEQNAAGFSTHIADTDDGKIYGLRHEARFLPFNGFEQTRLSNDGPNGGQAGDHQQDSILIAD